jgi:hypothetical protein
MLAVNSRFRFLTDDEEQRLVPDWKTNQIMFYIQMCNPPGAGDSSV